MTAIHFFTIITLLMLMLNSKGGWHNQFRTNMVMQFLYESSS